MSTRTPEQKRWADATYQAAKVLRAEGYDVEVTEFFVSKPTECPAGIRLNRPRDGIDTKGGAACTANL
jgi:hypothetical protein